ncbi:carbon-monoxide dehydrogenase small subunit [Tistlia consotensis]|uniref:Carbon-monoxide dehydrogenase small subunit n=1 Tax=Tistlia consotensis USBA 355 TaxID=560819 RepID=A0A1Y6CDP0_9PROT|nr:2Fe-2S iron-sulfur cluster-binding protein [Tistlia consotensis]SMF48861.1 carbon-monoxide dehydrogenase small subunit [Tistlia consotensis USBA 355]SNR80698.1 carbon-monoxide dehydrogenase small subunit [Tistlia consotensis]
MKRTVPLALTVNGDPVEAQVEPRTHLADFLRGALGLTGTHLGCEHGVCGACTVMIDGQPARSCITFAAACDGAEVRTVEGFSDDPTMAALREAFSQHHGLQCGYCTPGMLISARDVVARLPGADEQRVRLEMSGNLCRCTGYMGIVAAVKQVAGQVAEGVLPPGLPTGASLAGLPRVVAGGVSAPPAAPAPERLAETPAESLLSEADASWQALAESFTVGHPPAEVWRLFEDVAAVAGCLPGAELSEVAGERLTGRLRVKFGPIRGAFEGEGRHRPDPAAQSGLLQGSGLDRNSGSRARGEARYRLEPAGAGTRVSVEVRYQLTGPLAQFGRSGLVRDFAGRLTAEFARNLSARLEGGAGAARPARELDAVSLTLSVIWSRIRRLFGG